MGGYYSCGMPTLSFWHGNEDKKMPSVFYAKKEKEGEKSEKPKSEEGADCNREKSWWNGPNELRQQKGWREEPKHMAVACLPNYVIVSLCDCISLSVTGQAPIASGRKDRWLP